MTSMLGNVGEVLAGRLSAMPTETDEEKTLMTGKSARWSSCGHGAPARARRVSISDLRRSLPGVGECHACALPDGQTSAAPSQGVFLQE